MPKSVTYNPVFVSRPVDHGSSHPRRATGLYPSRGRIQPVARAIVVHAQFAKASPDTIRDLTADSFPEISHPIDREIEEFDHHAK